MEKRIQRLSKEVSERIAAGEVIERPSSVIKELVENSIDASSHFVRIDILNGGIKRLSVFDDGIGIPANDLLLALERHATSKLVEVNDLWSLKTMGFRGEALPSIASISRFTIESKKKNCAGKKIYLEGAVTKSENTSAPNSSVELSSSGSGTLVVVEDLFFNVPARLKFLKSKTSESAQVKDVLLRLALANPSVGFQFFSEERKVFDFPAETQKSRIVRVLETTEDAIEEISSEFEGISFNAWVDRNARAASSKQVYLAVNGRVVKDKLFLQAVLSGLRPRMMEGEFPKGFFELHVPLDQIDVNVHPSKTEVRFEKSKDIFQIIYGALSRLSEKVAKPYYDSSYSEDKTRLKLPSFTLQAQQESFRDREQQPTLSEPMFVQGQVQYKIKSEPIYKKIENEEVKSSFFRMQYVGQVKNTYLLFQDESGVLFIDQHAAHERVNYEKIKKEYFKGLRSQPVLVSVMVKCTPEQVSLALDYKEVFEKSGFFFESFGNDSLVIREIPEFLDSNRAKDLFLSILATVEESPDEAQNLKANELSPREERVLSTSACHASVRAGQSLSQKEAVELAEQMEKTPAGLNCPHGRPASIRLTYSQIEAMFKRV